VRARGPREPEADTEETVAPAEYEVEEAEVA
jgi:hypothetical protein